MSSRLTKIVLSILVTSFLIPSGFFLRPEKVEAAGTDCAAVIFAAMAPIIGKSAASMITGVNVSDSGTQAGTAATAGTSYGTFFKDCVLTPIAIHMAKAMLQNITQSTVDWINHGFKGPDGKSGSPSFVTDLSGLLTDTTDQAIGEFLTQDLTRSGFLCSSFALQVRLAVAQTNLPYRQRAACSLTQIKNNVNGFIQGDNSGGWDNWIQVTTEPQNNVYGATLLAQNELSQSIANKINIQNRELDWAKGFRSWKECAAQALDENGKPYCTDWTTQTPGAVVEAQLENSLGSDVRQLEVATDINAILNALENQLTMQVMSGAKGLLGAGKNTSGAYNPATYQNAINNTVNDPNMSAAIDAGINQISTDANLGVLFGTQTGTSTPTVAQTPPPIVDQNGEITGPGSNGISWNLKDTTPIVNPIVNSSTPLKYNISLSSTYAARDLTVQTTLRKNGVVIPFMTAFSSFRVGYGRVDGGIAFKDITSSTDASAVWSKVSADPNIDFLFNFSGTKNNTAPTGVYTLETSVSDFTGVLQVETSTFNIQ